MDDKRLAVIREHLELFRGCSPASVAGKAIELLDELDRARARENALRGFAGRVMGDECGDVDGFVIQEAALEFGLLKPAEVTEPCSEEACACAEMGSFPLMCNRRTPLLTGEFPTAAA